MSFLKSIRNIFSLEPWPNIASFQLGTDEILIHEEDVRQIELIPSENFEYANEEIERVRKFAEEHFDGKGYTDMYIRDEPPTKLTERQISFFDLVTPFFKDGFRLKDMRFMGKPLSGPNPAIQKNDFTFFLSLNNKWVNAIYFNKQVYESQLGMEKIIYLSQKYDLFLVDWWKLMVVETKTSGVLRNPGGFLWTAQDSNR